MNRSIIATAVATAFFSLTALEAAAAPSAISTLLKTHALQCSAGQSDGELLKANQTIIKNITGATIAKGTKITITYRVKTWRNRTYTRTAVVIAYRDIYANATIPMGDSGRAVSCTASVQLSIVNKVILKRVVR